MIFHTFGVPMVCHDFNSDKLNLIQTEIDKVIDNIRNLDLTNPWGDTVNTTFKYNKDTKDLDTYNLTTLVEEIKKLAYHILPDSTLTLSESWFNFSYKSNFQFDHTHGNFRVSGVYYYKTNGQDGDIVFTTPNPYEKLGISNISNKLETINPKVGRAILFPSYLEHRVTPNLTNHERISISFNFK